MPPYHHSGQNNQLGIVAVTFICGLIILRYSQSSSSSASPYNPNAISPVTPSRIAITNTQVEPLVAQHENLRANGRAHFKSFTAPQWPVDASICKEPLLLGTAHHGGWKICRDSSFISFDANCIVYSYGLGADWSFDKAAEDYGCEVHGFDPSGLLWRQGMHGADYSGIDYMRQYPSKRKFFHNWGIGAVSRAVYPIGSSKCCIYLAYDK